MSTIIDLVGKVVWCLVVNGPKSPKLPDGLFDFQFVCLHTMIVMIEPGATVPGITRTFWIAFACWVLMITTPIAKLSYTIKELDLFHYVAMVCPVTATKFDLLSNSFLAATLTS